MIKKLYLKNFKAFKTVDIEIKPITILIGPNNSGKTSILQSIGLLKQTFNSNGNDVLKFIGDIDFGAYENIHHQNAFRTDQTRFRIEFDNGNYFDTDIDLNNKKEIYVKNYSCSDGQFELHLENIREIVNSNGKKNYFVYDKMNLAFKDFDFENVKDLFNQVKIYRDNCLFSLYFDLDNDSKIESIFAAYSRIQPKGKDDQLYNAIKVINELVKIQTTSSLFNKYIKSEFSKIIYIGPIRTGAQRLYSIEKFNNVGFKGEHAVQMIAENPQLYEETKNILKQLGIVEDISIDKKGMNKNILELKIKTQITDNNVNFADVGCGTSQILPLVVEILSAKDDSLILIEQPEAHLHPKLQQDFATIIATSTSGHKKIVLETHSEYIIERIRTLVIKKIIPSSDVIIYYIEQNPSKKTSEIEEIRLNSDGTYSYIPENYLTNFSINEIDDQLEAMLHLNELNININNKNIHDIKQKD